MQVLIAWAALAAFKLLAYKLSTLFHLSLMKKILLLFAISLLGMFITATELKAQINVNCDPQVENMMQVFKNANVKETKIEGYRIQIVQTSDRDKVRKLKTELLQDFPDMRVYETYEAPFFKLRTGNFTSRYEAYQVLVQLKEKFNGIFIVPDDIKESEL